MLSLYESVVICFNTLKEILPSYFVHFSCYFLVQAYAKSSKRWNQPVVNSDNSFFLNYQKNPPNSFGNFPLPLQNISFCVLFLYCLSSGKHFEKSLLKVNIHFIIFLFLYMHTQTHIYIYTIGTYIYTDIGIYIYYIHIYKYILYIYHIYIYRYILL